MDTGLIYLGDNVDSADLFIEDETVDLTVTSPPYDDMRKYTEDQEWSWTQFERVADMLFRVTKPGGVVVWNVNDKTHKGSESGTSFKQVLHFMEVGFLLADTMIWEKTCSGALGSNKLYLQNFEYMFVLSKGPHTVHNLIEDRENVAPAGMTRKMNASLVEGKATRSVVGTARKFGRRTNIWRINQQQRSAHPAPFPVQLVRDHIKTWTNEGDVVFDPFMGSGTTAVAAEAEKRAWIGCEISAEYLALAEQRIKGARDRT